MELKESGEMYLETIYILSKELENVRSLDVARYMKFSKPSVSRAMGLLRNSRYIAVDEKGYISLTNSGLEIAEKIYERHIVITKLLTDIGVDPETAAEDACRIEHVISDESFNAIKAHLPKQGKKSKSGK
ncbi:MAG: metal-dependent transcriptional regulator [Clostridiales bacterium]|jgi:Mn-dependent DtxR family transcriptional regulator|nr:metal-dependent transcriptional regulator [Clostridiales bacterium]